MHNRYRAFALIIILLATIILSGCATIRTMPSLGSHGTPKVMSGARLDYNAATDDQEELKKFTASAPDHPVLDLPFSATLDLIIIPITLSVAAYELVFE
ncbi:MAG: YceK/YidQ family lipoprotein [Nitrospirota bacterium]|nr:YceK/YidQ family lipoprotein [Nitrospirota bacterium]